MRTRTARWTGMVRQNNHGLAGGESPTYALRASVGNAPFVYMPFFFIIFAALLGACIGSFCNVLIVRLHEEPGISGILGRSRCTHCRRPLQASHLVPLVSWVALRARCAFCGKPIHWQYPAVEAAGAAIGVVSLLWASHGGTSDITLAAFTAIFLFVLLVVAAFDLRWRLVPLEFVLGSALLLGAWAVRSAGIGGSAVLASVLVGGVATAAPLAAFAWLSNERLMGKGDWAVGLLLGVALGWPLGPLSLGLAFLIGGMTAAVLLLLRVVHRKTPVPFVPFLAAGACVAYFWGEPILRWLIAYAAL